MEINYPLIGDYIELSKLLKVVGICDTGGHAKLFISEGLVAVDGVVETRKKCKIRRGQWVQVDSQRILIT
ncbi:RNA-binding S4 domain-containing protein [bacterium]|nr:RNA-binding S4 domain-containing protein [bacterium]